MRKNLPNSLALVFLRAGLFFTACEANRGQQGVHMMGSAPMSDAKHPGKVPDNGNR